MITEIIAIIVFILLALTGLIISFIGISGTWLVLAGAILFNIITWSWHISLTWLIGLVILAIIGEIIEFIMVGITAKTYGTSKTGMIAAMAGGIAGAIIGIPGFLFGSILGLLVGAFVGALVVEAIIKKDFTKGFCAGIGAFTGAIGGIVAKFLITIIMIVIVLIVIF